MVLMATIGISALSLVLIQNKKTAALNSIRLAGDRDVENIVATIQTLMASPPDCNANFKGKRFAAPYTAFTSLKKCSGGNCNGTGTAVVALNMNNWQVVPGEAAKKARIISVTYSLTSPQSSDASGNRPRIGFPTAMPGIVTLSVVIEKNLGLRGSTIVTSKNILKPYTFEANVITSSYDYATANVADFNPKIISGCARSPVTVMAYPN